MQTSVARPFWAGWLVVFLLLGFLINSGLITESAHAQTEPEITASLASPFAEADAPALTVGDLITLTIQVTHPTGYRPLSVELEDNWGPLEVRTVSQLNLVVDGQADPSSERSHQTVIGTLWTTGTHTIPAFTISIADLDGGLAEVSTNPLTLTVRSVLVEGDETLRDIKPQATMPIPAVWPWLVGLALGALLLFTLLGGLGWWLYRRYQQRQGQSSDDNDDMPAQPVDLRPAYQIALEELTRIRKLELPVQDRFKEHYTLVTDATRHYLENGFGVTALEATTSEIRRTLRQSDFPVLHQQTLISLLEEADFVKFAKVTPTEEQADALLMQAYQLVEATRVKEEDGER
ncbi:MAG: hypothetical protein AAF639_16515 [Chloroflexota bacterium]